MTKRNKISPKLSLCYKGSANSTGLQKTQETRSVRSTSQPPSSALYDNYTRTHWFNPKGGTNLGP